MAYKKYWGRIEIMITHYLVQAQSENFKDYNTEKLLNVYISPPRNLKGVEIHDEFIFKVPANIIQDFLRIKLFSGGVKVTYSIVKEIIQNPANERERKIEEALSAALANKEAIAGGRAAREAAFLTMLATKNNMTERESTIVRDLGKAYKQMEQFAEKADSLAKNAIAGRLVNDRGSPSAEEVERNKKDAEDLISQIKSAPVNVTQYFRGGELIRPIEEVMERVYAASTRAQVAIDKQNEAIREERLKTNGVGSTSWFREFHGGGRRRTRKTRRVKRKGTKAKKSRQFRQSRR